VTGRAADTVHKFANIARPAMRTHRLDRFVGESADLMSGVGTAFFQHVIRECLDILTALPERRFRNAQHTGKSI
jgi:hypothetical protein